MTSFRRHFTPSLYTCNCPTIFALNICFACCFESLALFTYCTFRWADVTPGGGCGGGTCRRLLVLLLLRLLGSAHETLEDALLLTLLERVAPLELLVLAAVKVIALDDALSVAAALSLPVQLAALDLRVAAARGVAVARRIALVRVTWVALNEWRR